MEKAGSADSLVVERGALELATGRIAWSKQTTPVDVEQLQADLDLWLEDYNHSRPHSDKYCFGKTPMQTFLDSLQLAWDKILDREAPATVAVA